MVFPTHKRFPKSSCLLIWFYISSDCYDCYRCLIELDGICWVGIFNLKHILMIWWFAQLAYQLPQESIFEAYVELCKYLKYLGSALDLWNSWLWRADSNCSTFAELPEIFWTFGLWSVVWFWLSTLSSRFGPLLHSVALTWRLCLVQNQN